MSLQINEKGLYITETRYLSLPQIQFRKHNLEQRVIRIRDRIADLKLTTHSEEKKLEQSQSELAKLSCPEVQNYVIKLQKERAEAEAKALALLKEVVGKELFATLQEKTWCSFTANDGGTYKITSRGHVFRKINNEWKKLCIIRPQELPLPDFVLAALINVREQPKKYALRFRR